MTDLAPRIALGALLSAAIWVGWRRRRGVREWAGRFGFATVAIAGSALIAFEVGPDRFAWSSFGLPWWVRMLGAPLGLYALSLPGQGRPSRAALLLLAGCGLLSASWVVMLMIARGWSRLGLSSRPHREARRATSAS